MMAEGLAAADDVVQRCEQSSFAELPEARAAAAHAEDAPDASVPASLREGGHIERRQTTYWDLVSRDG